MTPGETLDVIEGVTIIQPEKGYRVTTDSVLLARFSNPQKDARVLELGTGCGIVSILLAKRDPTLKITAVELQEDMAHMAERNVVINGLKGRINILNVDMRRLVDMFEGASFDYILTNPPYRSPGSGRLSPHPNRATGAHEVAVSLDDILRVSRHLLKVRGRMSMIYPVERLVDLLCAMRTFRIEPKEIRFIRAGKNQHRCRFFWIAGIREGGKGVRIGLTSNNVLSLARPV